MDTLKKIFNTLYLSALTTLVGGGVIGGVTHVLNWNEVFRLAYWVPPIALFAIISGQFDLLVKIESKVESVSLEARVTDFIHWLLLIGIDTGVWMRGSTTISALGLKLLLLAIIGWQIGIIISRQLSWTDTRQIILSTVSAITAFGLGLAGGLLRFSENNVFGYGWWFEILSAILATLLVVKFVWNDAKLIQVKGVRGYPRSLFIKGILSNLLIVWFWLHAMNQGGLNNSQWWLLNAGLTFNVIVGNLVYFCYWLIYEYYRDKEEGQ